MNGKTSFSLTTRHTCFGFCLALLLLLGSLKAERPYVSPLSQNVFYPRQYAPGASVTLSDQNGKPASGLYQWFHNDSAIPGATLRDLALTNLSAADSGNYRLRNTDGATIQWSDTLTINILPFPPSPVDLSFVAQGLGVDGSTSILGVTADGSILVRNYRYATYDFQLVRLRNTGTVDPGFPPLPGDYSNPPSILALYPDGAVIVPSPAQSFRLSANGNVKVLPLPAGFDSSKPLTAAAVQSDGRLLIAQGNRLARLNTDDSVDTAFQYATTLSPLHEIKGLTLDSAGLIYVKAIEHTSNSYTDPSSWYVITRLIANGAEDTRFVHVRDDNPHSGDLTVYPLNDGRVLLVGSDNIGAYPFMRTSTGSVDPSWSFDGEGGYLNFNVVFPVAVDPAGRFFYIKWNGIHRAKITSTGLVDDGTFYQGDGVASDLRLTPDGQLLVAGSFNAWDGHLTANVARLRSADRVSFPPIAEIVPDEQVPKTGAHQVWGIGPITYQWIPLDGQPLVLSSATAGTGPFTYQWLALDGQPMPANTSSAQLLIANSAAVSGRYQLRITGPGGVSALSNVVDVEVQDTRPPYLANLSGRAMTGTGEYTVIAGLATHTVYATTSRALLRGGGPALRVFGVNNFLPNPAIDLYDSSGTLIANNDQWSANPDTAAAATATGAFSFAPGSNDAALVHEFPTGTATLMLKSQGQGDGIGLLEIYQLPYAVEEHHTPLDLLNLSFRAHTSPGEGTATAGFVIVDPQGFDRPVKVLLRAIGPTLGSYGIQHPLTNPILTVYNSKGEVVATNDDWAVNNSSADAATLTAAMKQVGAFDLTTDSKDSALLLNLPAGTYSMQATGGSGVVLLEVYLVK